MANKQISDLPSKTFGADSLVAHDVPNTNPSTMTQYPYVTGNATGNAVANFVANGLDYTTDLSTENKKITGAINELHSSIGADTYDENETYNKGDTVIHNGTLYACKDNSVTGTWDASHWDDTTLQPKTDNTLSTTDKTVVGAINELKSGLSGVQAYRCKYDYTAWGTSKASEYTHVPFFRVQIDLDYYIASNGGDYINIRNIRTGTTQSGQIPSGQTSVSVTVDSYTFTKNVSDGKQNLTITTSSNKPIFIEYYL